MNRKYSPIALALFAIFLLFFMRGVEAVFAESQWLAPNWVLLGIQVIIAALQVRAYNSWTRNGYRFELVRKVHRVEDAESNELISETLTDPGESYIDEGTHDPVTGKNLTGKKRVYYGA